METATQETKIKKASLKNGTLEMEYDQIINDPELGPVIKTFKLKGGNLPHEDLNKALQVLAFHAVMIAEQLPPNTKNPQEHELLKGITVTGFSIGGSDEHEGVTLIAQRALKSGQVLNFIAPFTKWESDYKYVADLEPEMQVVLQECNNYLNGKYAPSPQLELELEPDGGTKEAA